MRLAPRNRGYARREMPLEQFVHAYHPAKSADKKHDQQQQHKHGHDVDQGDGQEEIAEHFYATQVDVIKQLPGLLPYIQRHAPPTEVLKAMEPTPPISNRPLSMSWGSGPSVTPIPL
mmetsp:Transcript_13876/g.39495  ORF Transcript_13876/g.39495 Transcript_13876/m.39495 type:complete len:117 (+) Transcript_13876:244-594(+)